MDTPLNFPVFSGPRSVIASRRGNPAHRSHAVSNKTGISLCVFLFVLGVGFPCPAEIFATERVVESSITNATIIPDEYNEKEHKWSKEPFIRDELKGKGLSARQSISCFLNIFRAPELFEECLLYHKGLMLFGALEEGDLESAKDYIIKGAYLNLQDKKNRETVLHIAVKRGYTEIVSLLLNKEANPNIPNIDGQTALDLLDAQEYYPEDF